MALFLNMNFLAGPAASRLRRRNVKQFRKVLFCLQSSIDARGTVPPIFNLPLMGGWLGRKPCDGFGCATLGF
jgi:hypothetical protein